MARRPSSPDDFPVAIICALQVEYDAISLLVDWWGYRDRYGAVMGDDNTYKTGRMGNVNIVLVRLSGTGKSIAAAAVARLQLCFPRLKLILLTGVCGGVPSMVTDREMSLGDVIVGDSVVPYDHGKQYPNDFKVSHHVGDRVEETTSVRSLIVTLDNRRELIENQVAGFLQRLQNKASSKGEQAKYKYPGTANDRLFEPGYHHKHWLSTPYGCAECCDSPSSTCEKSRELSCEELGWSDNSVVRRSRLESKRCLEEDGLLNKAQAPLVFCGRFASGDTVMKSAEHRDKIAKQYGAMAFEMEGAGVLQQQLPYIIIKGVCDYADSHKDEAWQRFAAATAASMTRALVEHHSYSLLAGAQGRPTRRAHYTHVMSLPRVRRQQVFCYRCHYRSHKRPNCFAREETVWEGRAKRKDEGRCMNCGASDHWWRDCDLQDLL
ncbi:CCHC-type domain-containing protein [Fusarium sp. Ph1]|nr:CCHC-type domain-containing protein [Fusarium sp. Ph1]